jgi:hypothetical protein
MGYARVERKKERIKQVCFHDTISLPRRSSCSNWSEQLGTVSSLGGGGRPRGPGRPTVTLGLPAYTKTSAALLAHAGLAP